MVTGSERPAAVYLAWDDVIVARGRESLVVRRKPGFTPEDYEEREVPIPSELATVLRAREHNSPWVFPSRYLNPDGDRKRAAVSRLILPAPLMS